VIPAARRFRILIVDDYRDAADTLALLLRLGGHEARTAGDGPTALDVAREFHPDVVFLDLGLPGMDGCEVAKRLRHEASLKRPLLVALTGHTDGDSIRRVSDGGFDHHLLKPADPSVIDALIGWLAGRPIAHGVS
jgi:CheY-like chemotaxis protein